MIAEAEARLHQQQEARQKVEAVVRQRAEQEKHWLEEIAALQVTERELRQRIQEAEERRRLQSEAVSRAEAEMRAMPRKKNYGSPDLEAKRQNAEEESPNELNKSNSWKTALISWPKLLRNRRNELRRLRHRLPRLRAHSKPTKETCRGNAGGTEIAEGSAKASGRQSEAAFETGPAVKKEIATLQSDAKEQAKKIAALENEVSSSQEAALAQSEAEVRLREELERLQQAKPISGCD